MPPCSELQAKLVKRLTLQGEVALPAQQDTMSEAAPLQDDAFAAEREEEDLTIQNLLMQRELDFLEREQAPSEGTWSEEAYTEDLLAVEGPEDAVLKTQGGDALEIKDGAAGLSACALGTLQCPSPEMWEQVYASPLEFTVHPGQEMTVYRRASTGSPSSGTLRHGDRVAGHLHAAWLRLCMPERVRGCWVPSLQLGHQHLRVRILRTFTGALLLEWDKLPGASFVDYTVEWARKAEPESVVVALDHLPRSAVRLEGLPPEQSVLVRVRACIYTGTKSNQGQLFAAVVGEWQEARTTEETWVEALEHAQPEKMPDVYSEPLKYRVDSGEVRAHQAASTRSACVRTFPAGQTLSGYQQDQWLLLQEVPKGWVFIDGNLAHDSLRAEIVQAFSTAVEVQWCRLVGPRFVHYSLQWSTETTQQAPATGACRLTECKGLCHGLPSSTQVSIRVCAHVCTSTGRPFAEVFGKWESADTELPIETVEEEQLCLDHFSNMRGRCHDCDCHGFVCQRGEASGRCSRCGCSVGRHAILGEYHYRHKADSKQPLGFKVPAGLLREATRDAKREAIALEDSAPPLKIAAWRPEDSGQDEDRVEFVLEKIAQAGTLYEVLGITPVADDQEVRRAHRRIALYIHPDKVLSRNDPELVRQAEAAFKIVSAAYDVLGDEAKRVSYNKTVVTEKRARSSRKDLVAARLLKQFLGKSMWGWDLNAKPPGEWQSFGKGVYSNKPSSFRVTLVHVITGEDLTVNFERQSSVIILKKYIIAQVRRGSVRTIELATVQGEILGDDHVLSSSQTLALAGISKFGPAKKVKVCLSHARTGARLYVEVPDTSSVEDVSRAAAVCLKVDPADIRLGIRWDNEEQFCDLPGAELLNGRTQMLVLGVEVPVNLSVDEALELQAELVEAYRAPWFQAQLEQLIARYPPLEGLVDPGFRREWDEMLRRAQKDILVKHGFDGLEGAHTMIRAFEKVNHSPDVQRLGADIDRQLKVTVGTALPPVVFVTIEPAIADEDGHSRSLRVAVLPTACIRDVCEAIARKLGVEARKITLGAVQQFGAFSACGDSEKLGSQRSFKALGVSLPRSKHEDAPSRKAPEVKPRTAPPPRSEVVTFRTCGECFNQAPDSVDGVGDSGVWYCNSCWAAWHMQDGRQQAADRAGRAAGEAVVQHPKPSKAHMPPRFLTLAEEEEIQPAKETVPEQVRVLVQHAGSTEPVDVDANATWLDVKRKLGRSLAMPEVVQFGKLVRREESGDFSVLGEEAAVGRSQCVLLVNVGLPAPEAEPQKEPGPVEKELEIVPLPWGPTLTLLVFSSSTGLDVMDAIAHGTQRPLEEVMQGALLKPNKGTSGHASVEPDEVVGHLQRLHTKNVDTSLSILCRRIVAAPQQRKIIVAPCVQEHRSKEKRPAVVQRGPELAVVTVSHALNKGEVAEVVVLDDCPLSAVLETLARQLKLPAIPRQGRFVERKGKTGFRRVNENQPLGERRQLLYMGTDLRP